MNKSVILYFDPSVVTARIASYWSKRLLLFGKAIHLLLGMRGLHLLTFKLKTNGLLQLHFLGNQNRRCSPYFMNTNVCRKVRRLSNRNSAEVHQIFKSFVEKCVVGPIQSAGTLFNGASVRDKLLKLKVMYLNKSAKTNH